MKMTHNFIEVTLSGSVNEPNKYTTKRLINTRWIEQVIPFDNFTMICKKHNRPWWKFWEKRKIWYQVMYEGD